MEVQGGGAGRVEHRGGWTDSDELSIPSTQLRGGGGGGGGRGFTTAADFQLLAEFADNLAVGLRL